LFGVENDYRTDITNEVQCIATAQSQDMGACVYESDFDRICDYTTRGECDAGGDVDVVDTNVSISGQKKFYKDYLCSAEELSTSCAKQAGTTCYQGDVFWTDSCGNRENTYSDDKAKSWNSGQVIDADSICDPNDGSDVDCGNCDYMLGSRCAEYDGFLGGPSDGDYYCQKTECEDRNGDERVNGESWCIYDEKVGGGGDPAGSRYYREVCIDGEVIVEPCADFRNEVCLQGSIEIDGGDGDFQTAACRVNRWQDCVLQIDGGDCTNIDQRDCVWKPSVTGMMIGGDGSGGSSGSSGSTFSNPTSGDGFDTGSGLTGNAVAPITGQAFLGIGGDDDDEEDVDDTQTNRPNGVCIPNFPPGLEFWTDNNAQQMCGQANAHCVIVYEEGLIGGKDCVENCECEKDAWALGANRVCAGLGDCGGYVNYQGVYTNDGYEWIYDGAKKKFKPNTVNNIKSGFTGQVVAGAITGNVIGGITGHAIEDILDWFGPVSTQNKDSNGNIVSTKQKTSNTNVATGKKISNIGSTYASYDPLKKYDVASQNVASQNSGDKSTGFLSALTLANTGVTTSDNVKRLAGNKDGAGNLVDDGAIPGTSAGDSGDFVDLTNGGVDGVDGATGEAAWFAKGGAVSSIGMGLAWAAGAYVVGQMIGPMLGLSDGNTQALSTALAAGAGVAGFASSYTGYAGTSSIWGAEGLLASHPMMVGAGVGVVVFAVMYKSEETVTVDFNCQPWQAPNGGNDCEICNVDNLPCSEYRCKSLGQNCEIVNAGSDQETCVNVNPRDTNPPIIKPSYTDLSSGHEYTNVKNSPPGPGFNIIKTSSDDGCLKAFTPLEFGLETDEPAQCKVDFNHTSSFDEMRTYFGKNNFYLYNHTEKFSLPSAAALKASDLILENGADLTFFIRCQDKNGNQNEAEYAVRMCVDPTPDTTAPRIDATSIVNGGCIAEDQDTAEVNFYTNEPAECRWSPQDQDFELMDGTMSCNNQIYQANAAQLYTCNTELTGIPREEANFYIRCKDHAEQRNTMKQSYEFSLRGSTALKMLDLRPNETIFGSTSPAPVELYAQTVFGCNKGQAICAYSLTGNNGDYIQFFDTNTEDGIHTQRLDLTGGNHEIYVKCTDAGGNLIEDVAKFTLDVDTAAPVVARIYEENELLKLITVRDSECAYTFDNCDFTFEEGTSMPYANSTVHVTDWVQDKTYYIKCRDAFKNEDADCSVIVRPTRNLFE